MKELTSDFIVTASIVAVISLYGFVSLYAFVQLWLKPRIESCLNFLGWTKE